MSRLDLYPKRHRHFIIPKKEKQFTDKYILNEIDIANLRTPSKYSTGEPCGKPGTTPDPLSVKAYLKMIVGSNPNNVDGHMFLGSYELEKEAISMTANMLGINNEIDPYSGFFLSGGTESTNQSIWTYRNKFFNEKKLNIRKSGMEIFKKLGYVPKILASIDSHFAIKKSIDQYCIGYDNIVFYGLNDDFSINFNDLERKIINEYKNGHEFFLNLVIVGDTVKGKIHDVEKIGNLISNLSNKYGIKMPPTVVDASGQYLFLSTMKNSKKYSSNIPNWDFNCKYVNSIICDPHKNQIPYNTGIVLFRDFNDTKHTNFLNNYLSIDMFNTIKNMSDREIEISQIMSTIPTSRGGYGAAATWAYYMKYGIDGIMKKKEKIWEITNNLKKLLENSKNYDVICNPETTNVVFRLKNSFDIKENEKIYKIINNSSEHNLYIGHDNKGLAKNQKEKNEKTNKFYTLYANLMDHNSIESNEKLIYYLEKEAEKLK